MQKLNLETVVIEECCEILDSMRIPVAASKRRHGEYPYYGANGIQGYVDSYIFNDELVLLAEDGGNFGSKKKPIAYRVSGKCWVNNHAHVLKPKKGFNADYICYALMFYNVDGMINGATRKKLTQSAMRQMQIPRRNEDEQFSIVQELNLITSIKAQKNKQLLELDELTKSRFVELFGDPVENPHGYEKVALSELAEIKIGPFGSLLHKEDYIEGGHALLNPSHIIEGKVAPDNKLTISEEKYQELSAYHLKNGDVVMGRRGEMGRCAVVPCDGYLCGTGSLLIRTKGEVTADYIQKIISFPSFKKMIEDMAVGQTMPNLNVPIVSNFQIIKPSMEIQGGYYKFIEQVDKSKAVIQKSLDETQLLFDSLMQKYFG